MSPLSQRSATKPNFLSRLDRPVDRFGTDGHSQTRKLTPRKIDDIMPFNSRSPHTQSQGNQFQPQSVYRSPSRVKDLLQQPIYTFQKGVSQQSNEINNREAVQIKQQFFSPKAINQNYKLQNVLSDVKVDKLFDTEEKTPSQNKISIDKFERMSDISIIKRNTFFLHQEESYNCFKGDRMSSELYTLFGSSHINCNLTKNEAAIRIQRAYRRFYTRKQFKLLKLQETAVKDLESLLENYIKEVKSTSMAEGIMKLKLAIIKIVLRQSFTQIKRSKVLQAPSHKREESKVEIKMKSAVKEPIVAIVEEESVRENPFDQVYSILGQVNQIIRQIHHKEEEQTINNNAFNHNSHFDSILSMETKKTIKKTALKQFINAGLQKENLPIKDHSNRHQQIIKPPQRKKSRNSKEDFSFVNTISECGLSTVNSFNNKALNSKENLDPSQSNKNAINVIPCKNGSQGFDYRHSYEQIKEKFLASKASMGSLSPGRLPIMTPEFNSVINFSQ